MFDAAGRSPIETCAGIVKEAGEDNDVLAKVTACCLGIRTAREVPLDELEKAVAVMSSLLPEEANLVVSTHLSFEIRNEVEMSLMTIAGWGNALGSKAV